MKKKIILIVGLVLIIAGAVVLSLVLLSGSPEVDQETSDRREQLNNRLRQTCQEINSPEFCETDLAELKTAQESLDACLEINSEDTCRVALECELDKADEMVAFYSDVWLGNEDPELPCVDVIFEAVTS